MTAPMVAGAGRRGQTVAGGGPDLNRPVDSG